MRSSSPSRRSTPRTTCRCGPARSSTGASRMARRGTPSAAAFRIGPIATSASTPSRSNYRTRTSRRNRNSRPYWNDNRESMLSFMEAARDRRARDRHRRDDRAAAGGESPRARQRASRFRRRRCGRLPSHAPARDLHAGDLRAGPPGCHDYRRNYFKRRAYAAGCGAGARAHRQPDERPLDRQSGDRRAGPQCRPGRPQQHWAQRREQLIRRPLRPLHRPSRQ